MLFFTSSFLSYPLSSPSTATQTLKKPPPTVCLFVCCFTLQPRGCISFSLRICKVTLLRFLFKYCLQFVLEQTSGMCWGQPGWEGGRSAGQGRAGSRPLAAAEASGRPELWLQAGSAWAHCGCWVGTLGGHAGYAGQAGYAGWAH